jgi:hypothetical protein
MSRLRSDLSTSAPMLPVDEVRRELPLLSTENSDLQLASSHGTVARPDSLLMPQTSLPRKSKQRSRSVDPATGKALLARLSTTLASSDAITQRHSLQPPRASGRSGRSSSNSSADESSHMLSGGKKGHHSRTKSRDQPLPLGYDRLTSFSSSSDLGTWTLASFAHIPHTHTHTNTHTHTHTHTHGENKNAQSRMKHIHVHNTHRYATTHTCTQHKPNHSIAHLHSLTTSMYPPRIFLLPITGALFLGDSWLLSTGKRPG